MPSSSQMPMDAPPYKNVVKKNKRYVAKKCFIVFVLKAKMTIIPATNGLMSKFMRFGKIGEISAIPVPKMAEIKICHFFAFIFASVFVDIKIKLSIIILSKMTSSIQISIIHKKSVNQNRQRSKVKRKQ